MKSIIFSTTAFWLCVSSFADTIHVPSEAPTIQIAISKAAPFDTIIVAPGEYFEAISFGGKVITVQSSNPNDPAVVANTIINAGGLGSVVTFSGGEDQANSVLDGFTITGGTVGIDAHDSKAVIRRCIIRDNSSYGILLADGRIEDCTVAYNGNSGVKDCDGIIERCAVRNNAGNGLEECDGMLTDSTVETNHGHGVAGGIVDILRCVIRDNHASGIGVYSCCYSHMGGIDQSYIVGNLASGIASQCGASGSEPIRNSVIAGNRQSGFSCSSKNVLSCTVAGNKQYGFANHTGTIRHVVIWDNVQGALTSSTTPLYSGTSNPYFVEPGFWDQINDIWVDGDYHLSPDSPYINAGDPSYGSAGGNPTIDLDGNPRIAGPRVDIGAFEFQGECDGVDLDEDGTPDICDGDIDGDGVTNVLDVCDDTRPEVPVASNGRPLADLDNDCSVNLKDFAEFQKSMSAP